MSKPGGPSHKAVTFGTSEHFSLRETFLYLLCALNGLVLTDSLFSCKVTLFPLRIRLSFIFSLLVLCRIHKSASNTYIQPDLSNPNAFPLARTV
jgi:hypothetical protein